VHHAPSIFELSDQAASAGFRRSGIVTERPPSVPILDWSSEFLRKFDAADHHHCCPARQIGLTRCLIQRGWSNFGSANECLWE
jgi:hypothetical protein